VPSAASRFAPQHRPNYAKWSDREVADVVSYIRNAWGNAATADDVAKLRKK
jgi:hypothetical protein